MGNEKKARMSKLPPELWREIGKRLRNRIDVTCFRSVCKEWRSCLPRPSRFPLRVPPPPPLSRESKASYLVTEIESYVFDKKTGLSFEGAEEFGIFRIEIFPPWGVFDFSPRELSRLRFVSKSYRICMSLPSLRPPPSDTRYDRSWAMRSTRKSLRRAVVKTVVISSNADGCVAADYARDISVVALLTTGKLAILRLHNNSDWDTDSFKTGSRFVYIATYKGQLYAMDTTFAVFLIDYHSLQMTPVPSSIIDEPELVSERALALQPHLARFNLFS